MRLSTLLFVAFSGLAVANPLAENLEPRAPAPTTGPELQPEKRAAFCPTVKSRVRRANQQAQASAFCKSFVGGSTVTRTSVVTVSPTACVAPGGGAAASALEVDANVDAALEGIEKRAVRKPSSLNPYSGASLRRACGCLGITGGRTATTVTSTTMSGTPPAPSANFKMVASSNGNYGVLSSTFDISFSGSASAGSLFHLSSTNSITVTGGRAAGRVPHAADDDDPDFVSFNIETSPAVLSCTIQPKSDGTCPMTCSSFGSVNSLCQSTVSNEWYEGTQVGSGCTGFTPYAVTP